MSRNVLETLIGGVVLAVAAVFFVFAYQTGGAGTPSGYQVMARFDSVSGIRAGSDVRISGIKVGSVVGQSLDPQTFLAVLHLTIAEGIDLPQDTSARITSDGLLGDAYLSLSPGGADASLAPGDEIRYTQGAVDLISLVGRAVFGKAGDAEAAPGAAPSTSGQPKTE